jgi:lipid-A-disaccharide synthase-like uncharacterized protein
MYDKIVYGQFIYVIILYTIAYVYSLVYAPAIAKDSNNIINSYHESCIYGCQVCSKVTGGRGNNYYISNMNPEKKSILSQCLLSFWGLTHFMLYFIIGIVAPNLFWETAIVGAGFEVFEYFKYDCADPLDVIWNSLGFLTGKATLKLLTC